MVDADSNAAKSGTDSHDEQRLYQQGSLSSQLHESHGDIPMGTVMRNCDSKTNVSIRSRTSSGKSIQSRTAKRADYHENLKKELKQGFTYHLLFLIFIVMVGIFFIFGYNIEVLNQPVMVILSHYSILTLIHQFYNSIYTNRLGPVETVYTETNVTADELSCNVPPSGVDKYMIVFLWSLTTTLFVIGGTIGTYSAWYLANHIGRKKSFIINCIPCVVGAVVSTISVSANSPELLMLGRFITGINCGIATQLAPMYLLEIYPFNLKATFGTANQLFIAIGIFVGSVFGLREILGTVTSWPYVLLSHVVPSFICLVCMPFLPDSPRYPMLSKKNREVADKEYFRDKETYNHMYPKDCAINENRDVEIRDHVFSISLPGVDITHCNFTRRIVEVWYVTGRTDTDTIVKQLQKSIGSDVEPYQLRLVKKSCRPVFKYTSPGSRLRNAFGSVGAYITLTDEISGESNLHALVCGHGKQRGDLIYSDRNPGQRSGIVRVAMEGETGNKSYDVGLVYMEDQRRDRLETYVTLNGKKLQLATASTSLGPDQLADFQKVMLYRNVYKPGTVLYRNYNSRSENKFGIIGIAQTTGEECQAVHGINESGTLVVAMSPYQAEIEVDTAVKAVGMLNAIEEFTTYQTESISLAVPIERNLLELATDDYCKDKAIEFA